ncbi:MFS transporter [Saccharomonospora sp. CUA-673]|uniref:MFS transporter n=1 Tax=Saccharomonospora sp. CUA-673 TaxID=1904969 RepID=UPI00096A3305|nr:MFS transporter [Saccharomonospora sp. CUA-673]
MPLVTPRDLPRAEPGEVLVEPPTEKARPLLISAMAIAQLGLFLALMTPIMVSLAIKVQTIVPEERQVTALGIVTSIGSIAAMLANPIFGRISDRTTSRFGRRRPWLVVGMFGLLVSLLIIALAQSVAMVTVGFFLASIFANAALAAFVATVADHVPMFQRGRVSGLIGIMQNVAPMLGTYVARMFTENMLALFMIPGIVGFAWWACWCCCCRTGRCRSAPRVRRGGR